MNTKRIIICMLTVLLLLQMGGCKGIESMDSTNSIKISPTVFVTPTVAPKKAPTPAPTVTLTVTPTSAPTPAPTVTLTVAPTSAPTLTPAATAKVQRIDPYNYDYYNADLKKLLDETLNGRKIEALQGNERLNAELYTFWISSLNPDSQPDSKSVTKADYYNLGKEVLSDLNSDEKKERIKVEITHSSSLNCIDMVKLSINDQSVELELENAIDTFAIIDVDTKDKYKQIIIGEDGPSDDLSSEFFTFDGKKIIDCGGLVGTISPDYPGIDIDGSGHVFTMNRTDILQTWYYKAEYMFDKTLHLKEVLPAKGFYNTYYPVVVLKPLKVYKNRDVSSKQLTISDAQSAQLIGTDNKQWVLIKAADGTQGWILADSKHCYNVLNGDVSVPATDLLYNMAYFD